MGIKRLISGLIAFPVLAGILIFSNKYIADIAFSIIAVFCVHEFYKSFKTKAKPIEGLGYIMAIFIALLHIIPKEWLTSIITIAIPIIILVLFLYVIFTNMKRTVMDIMVTLLGICYVVLFIAFLALIYGKDNGKILIWYVIFAAWGTDILAYVIGKKFGKHKINNKISPNKSIEGCIAGIFGSIIFILPYTIIINNIFDLGISYTFILAFSVLTSIIGQIGDFAASCIKRYNEIKDFSNLIPGHGGMLDRFDSVIFIAPFAYFLLNII